MADGGGKQGELPICLLGGHGVCNEIIPGDVLHLSNKTCITFSRDQSTAGMHQQIGSGCVSKFQTVMTSPYPTSLGAARILKDSVEQLVQWLHDQQMDGKVVQLFKQYLLAGGTRTVTLLLKPNSRLGVEARFYDCLGWDCFLEGQLCALWVEHRAQHIQRANLTQLADF
jgi:hypothetical protein